MYLFFIAFFILAAVIGYVAIEFFTPPRRIKTRYSLPLSKAKKIAKLFLDRTGIEELVIDKKSIREYEFGFIFYVNTRKFLVTGNPAHSLTGSGLLVIDRGDREARWLPPAFTPDVAIAEYEAEWKKRWGKP